MKFSRVNFVVIIWSFLMFEYAVVVSGTILSKPSLVTVDASCGENEVYTRCHASPSCEKSCDNIDIWESALCIQIKSCMSGCICKEGYVRDKSRDICILENSCPRVRH